MVSSFRAGAIGVFCRTEPPSELRVRVERMSRGEISAGPTEAAYLLEHLRKRPSLDGIETGGLTSLTPRELEIAEAITRIRVLSNLVARWDRRSTVDGSVQCTSSKNRTSGF